jgi:hypothetical protein
MRTIRRAGCRFRYRQNPFHLETFVDHGCDSVPES